AAAALLLEKQPSRAPLAWLEDSWIGGDGTALIAVDERTVSLRQGLARVGGNADFIHAHATGTAHDAFELAAIKATCGDGRSNTPVFSCKGALGHSLGAAGLVSVALSTLCHAKGETFT